MAVMSLSRSATPPPPARQARFYAPASKQQLVRAIADATPTAPQLPDNN